MNINATLIGQTIAFLLFVWFCMKFVWPPLIKAIEDRQSQIANALASAEVAKKEQADAKILVEKELNEAKKQAQEIINMANKRRNEILEEVRSEAEAVKQQIVNQGYAEIDAERKRVREELRTQVATLVVTGAEKIISRSIDEAANNDIIEKLVAEL